MKQYWIDSHAHLNVDDLYNDKEQIFERMRENNVQRVLVISTSFDELDKAIKLKEEFNSVDLAFGFHPESVNSITNKDWEKLEIILERGILVAIGEIGLDYYWVQDNKELQKEVFKKQLELANVFNLPVIIHSRDAIMDTFEYLRDNSVHRKGVMHCYSGSVEMAKKFLDIGFFISFAGVITFKNAKISREVAKMVPCNRMLIETDSPYLTPVPFRGKRNESSYVRYVGEELCKIIDIDEVTLQNQLSLNYEELFAVKLT